MDQEIRNRQGERLDYSYAEGAAGAPLVVIGHGVTGNKDRPWAQALEQALVDGGLASLRMSFAGNGASEGRFVDSCVSKEVEDLDAMLSALVEVHGPERPLAYVGHSMGGAVGVLAAARDPRIRALVSLAGMVDTAAFVERKFGDLTPDQDLMWDLPDCPLSQTYVDDLRGIGSVAGKAPAIQVPWLLVHGTEDTVVPLQDSLDIQAAAAEPKPELVQLEGVDHVFSDAWAAQMCAAVVPWLRQALQTPD